MALYEEQTKRLTNSKENERLLQGGGRRRADGIKGRPREADRYFSQQVVVRTKSLKHYVLLL
jgi:hypothetical protein